MTAITATSEVVGVAAACAALGLPKATYYRHLRPKAEPGPRSPPARKLGDEAEPVKLDETAVA